MVEVVIGADGATCSSNMISHEPGLEAVARCVTTVLGANGFPAPTNGCATARVPLNFQPRRGDAGTK